ncbi:ABC transporter substrate-binding protein [Marinibacterium sp. SX1]|uniref:ABC transporter substrate-binding protein n=1 Tax=Marinibacterium sp. SX1 TaxID=3388424 RepID=UPI003D1702B0
MKVLFTLAAVAALIAGPALAETGVTDSEIRIGEISALSGPVASVGEAYTIGTRLAVEEINANGGINGRKVVLFVEDDGAQPGRTFPAAKKLIEQDQVFAFNGTSGSANVLAILPLLEEGNIPAIVSWAPNNLVYEDRVRPSVFVMGASYTETFDAALKYIHESAEPGDAVYGVIRQDDAFGETIEAAYDNAIENYGVKDGLRLKFKRGQTDFGAEALQLKQAGVDVVINGTIVSGTASLFKSMRQAGLEVVSTNVYTELMPASINLQKPGGYTYYVGDYVAGVAEPAGQAVIEKARKYLTDAEAEKINRYTFASYASMLIFAEAAGQCGADLTRDCYIEKLRGLDGFDTGGLTAPITFSKEEQRAGQASKVYKVDAATGEVTPVTGF